MESQGIIRLKRHQSVAYEVKISPYHDHEVHDDVVEFCLDPVQVAIARFSDENIRRLDHFDLVDVVKLSGVFSSREWAKSLRFMEDDELRMMAFLARRFCRVELSAAYKRRGVPTPFANDRDDWNCFDESDRASDTQWM